MHGYKHGPGCMATHMLQTSHAWLLKSNNSHHASMVTKGTTWLAWLQKRDNMACMVTKRGQHGLLGTSMELHELVKLQGIQEAYKYHGMPSFSSLQDLSKEVLKNSQKL